jgi:hypothetical protein
MPGRGSVNTNFRLANNAIINRVTLGPINGNPVNENANLGVNLTATSQSIRYSRPKRTSITLGWSSGHEISTRHWIQPMSITRIGPRDTTMSSDGPSTHSIGMRRQSSSACVPTEGMEGAAPAARILNSVENALKRSRTSSF